MSWLTWHSIYCSKAKREVISHSLKRNHMLVNFLRFVEVVVTCDYATVKRSLPDLLADPPSSVYGADMNLFPFLTPWLLVSA